MNKEESTTESLYQNAWESLKAHPLEVEAPAVISVSQHRTLFDRVPELVSRGLLVTVFLVATAQYFSLSLPLTVGFPTANLALAATLSGLFSALILGASIRAFRSTLFPSVPNGTRMLLSLGLLLLFSVLALLAQGTVTWYWAFNLSGPPARIDRGLLLLESFSIGFWNMGRFWALLFTVICGFLGVMASSSYLGRFAPWYEDKPFPFYAKVICGLSIFFSLSGILLLPSYIASRNPLTPSEAQLVTRHLEQFKDFRSQFSLAWEENYQGAYAEAVRTLSKGGLEGSDAQKSALLLSEYQGDDPREALVLILWIDQKLGFDQRRSAHDLEFEQKVVPKNLELWNRMREEGGASLLWQMRNTGTLFALEHLLENPDTSKQTLLELRDQLHTLKLTATDLQEVMGTWFIGIANASENQSKLWGFLSTPEQELRRQILRQGLLELSATFSSTEADGTALQALEKSQGDFSSVRSLLANRKAFTIGMVPAFSSDRLENLAQLPARLALARAGVEMRLFRLEHGRWPQNLEELEKSAGVLEREFLSLNQGTLSVEVLDLKYSVKVPK